MNEIILDKLAEEIIALFPKRVIPEPKMDAKVREILDNIEFTKSTVLTSQIISVCPKVSYNERQSIRQKINGVLNSTLKMDFTSLKEAYIIAVNHSERFLKHLRLEIYRDSNLPDLDFLDTMKDDCDNSFFKCVEKLKHYRLHKGVKNSRHEKESS